MTYKPPPVFTPFLRRFTDERALDLGDTIALYNEVRHAHLASEWGGDDAIERVGAFIVGSVCEHVSLPTHGGLGGALEHCLRQSLELETTIFSSPGIDWPIAALSMKEQVDLRRFLRAQQYFLGNDERVSHQLAHALASIFVGIIAALPPLPDSEEDSQFAIPLVSLLGNPHDVVDRIVGTICKQEHEDVGLFTTLIDHFSENYRIVSSVAIGKERTARLIPVTESDLSPVELVEAYLKNTPFMDLLLTPVPFVIPQSARFEHHWIVAGTGHGKTQTLQSLICSDLDAVANNKASIIVIDSQGDLIRNLSGLKPFAEGEALAGRLVLIDPTDIEFPVQLNSFSIGTERLDGYSRLDRERLLNSIIELYDFVLAALLGSELTSKQSVIFRFVTRALLQIPNATIHTLLELMEPGGDKKYEEHLSKLKGTARSFFANEFNTTQFAQTKREVLRRLYGILENQTFERMFSHPKNKLDLFKEMNSGKVILINAAKDLLKKQGTEIFGRFFIALIAQAAAERATLPANKRMPCFVYIDEAQDYIQQDANISDILEQARKQKVGLIIAHQYLSQLSQGILDSLYANTSIKFAGGVSDKDAHALARNMRTTADFIESQSKLSFAAHVRNLTSTAISLRIPAGELESWQRMSVGEHLALRDRMRAQYAVPLSEVELSAAELPPDEPTEFSDRY